MTSSSNTTLERIAARVSVPEPAYERMLRRRDRKRRSQRIAAGVVGMAIFVAAVLAVATVGSQDRTKAPAGGGTSGSTGPAETGPAETAPAETGPRETGPRETGPALAVGPVPDTDYLLDLNTGEMTPLPKGIAPDYASELATSPDGSKLAYVARGQIFISNLDGSGVEQVTRGSDAACSPAWSPDGSKIAYIGRHDGNLRDVFVLDLATGVSTQLSSSTLEPDPAEPDFGPWMSELPSFSSDGSSVVYNASRGDNLDRGEVEVRMVPVAGGDSVVLMRDRFDDGTASFYGAQLSPDGARLLFGDCEVQEPRRLAGICLANADGTDLRVIVGHDDVDADVAGSWSPDGTRIAYWEFHSYDVSIVNVATGEATHVAEGFGPTWLDDHTLIIQMDECYDPALGGRGRSCMG